MTGLDIQAYIQEEFGFHYHLSSVYKLLHKLGFSWITSRS
ncbi:helix-turn-helix domain-containing protein, partial [Psychromonas aquimarina]